MRGILLVTFILGILWFAYQLVKEIREAESDMGGTCAFCLTDYIGKKLVPIKDDRGFVLGYCCDREECRRRAQEEIERRTALRTSAT
ncbi:MAG TPA: hypothetical protein PLK35_03670 [Candidatus Moranbacteria bacterium]|nr:hypothetical protein [Candidatus Moranbacteria bacterium]